MQLQLRTSVISAPKEGQQDCGGSGRNTALSGLFAWPSFPSPALFSLVLSTEDSMGSGRHHPPLSQSSWTTVREGRKRATVMQWKGLSFLR